LILSIGHRGTGPEIQCAAVSDHSALVFDLDGTLSDPLEGIARCYNHALAAHGFATRSDTELATLVGPPLDQGFLALGVPTDHIAAIVVSYRQRYSELGYAENRLYDDIADVLAKLHGNRMGVCTSKRRDFAIRILEMFSLSHHFSFVSGGDIGISKAQQLRSLLDAGTIDHTALMIGDRAVDVHAAHANELPSCGVLWGFGSRDELAASQPTYLISKPDELLRFTA
jgi:phosphoglycolate phosphatase